MKIIGHTQGGYIVEASDFEMSELTGKNCSYNKAPVGQNIDAIKIVRHITAVVNTDQERSVICQNLRAAATLLENTPSVLTVLQNAFIQTEQNQ